jgi:hypothetical protein
MRATIQFYNEILEMKNSRNYSFDIHFDDQGFGEGEWKCLRHIYSDLKNQIVHKTFILGNDSDIMLGSFLMNSGEQEIYCIKMNLSRSIDENDMSTVRSCLYDWKTKQPMFKLLYFFMFCLTGNDYIPPILSGTNNQYATWSNILFNIEQDCKLYPKIQKYVKPLAEYVFTNDNKANEMTKEELLLSSTFVINFNAIVLSNISYKRDVVSKFLTVWNSFEYSIKHDSTFIDEKRICFTESNENGHLSDYLLAFGDFIRSSFWYLSYCTYFTKCTVVSEKNDLNTIPQFIFKFNDTRIMNRYEIKSTILRTKLYENMENSLYYCYFALESLYC